MHDGVCPEPVLEPAVGAEIVVARRQVGVVVDRHRVLPESTRGLDEDDDVPRPQGGEDELTGVVDEQLPRRSSPGLHHGVAQPGRQVVRPGVVLRLGDSHVCVGQLRLRQPLLVLAARRDQPVDEGVAGLAVGPVGIQDRHDRVVGAEVVPLVAHPSQ